MTGTIALSQKSVLHVVLDIRDPYLHFENMLSKVFTIEFKGVIHSLQTASVPI